MDSGTIAQHRKYPYGSRTAVRRFVALLSDMVSWHHKPFRVADASPIVLGLQDGIRRSEESRYDQRIHAVLPVAQGMRCPELARLPGAAPRTHNRYFSSLDEVISAAEEPIETWNVVNGPLKRLCAITLVGPHHIAAASY